MRPTLSSLRAKMLKSGRVIPIWTPEQWQRIKEERAKPLDLTPLIEAYGPYHGTTRKLETMYGCKVAKHSES